MALSNPVKEGKDGVVKEVSSTEVPCTKGKLLVIGKFPTKTIDLQIEENEPHIPTIGVLDEANDDEKEKWKTYQLRHHPLFLTYNR